jgi:hypothetical protein
MVRDSLYFVTIPHTGTRYFLDVLKSAFDLMFDHCESFVFAPGRSIATTYRDPYLVAASWANRDELQGKRNKEKWYMAWGVYKYLLTLDPMIFRIGEAKIQHGIVFGDVVVHSAPDKYNLHKSLNENNLEHYHKYVPNQYIEYAQFCCEGIA